MTTSSVSGGSDERLALAFSQHVVRLQGLLERAIAPALAAQGLTAAELDVLGALRSVGDPYQLRPKELTARLLLTTGGLSNVLRRLDARGLVSRVPDPQDGRSHNVRLTPTGIAAAETITAEATAALHGALSAVPTEMLEATLRQLRSILGAVDGVPAVSPAAERLPEARPQG
ncbi:MarR family winged helix-turn-helix transcriptional regulator [Streptomyces sp. NPDC058686]|uniref:MarR family winged helix-turn-helix transcriptional regulator n=1 Tax=Streptomyces sp. NPDC058686 TaxID=3346599 RepID=UPI003664880A